MGIFKDMLFIAKHHSGKYDAPAGQGLHVLNVDPKKVKPVKKEQPLRGYYDDWGMDGFIAGYVVGEMFD